MLVSIIVTNHNYGRFLSEAIGSALRQSYDRVEVIVVDDGSTDESREIVSSFGHRITPVLKRNGGQNSSVNAGFAASHGDVVIFLDADDILHRDAAAKHVEQLRSSEVSKSQGYLEVQDDTGFGFTGKIPERLSPSGDYRDAVLNQGLVAYQHAFTSGNAWARRFLRKVLPLPESNSQPLGVDGYLTPLDALFGRIASIDGAVGTYRIHAANRGPFSWTFTESSLDRAVSRKEERLWHLQLWASRLGYKPRPDRWREYSWRWLLERNSLSLMRGFGNEVGFAALMTSPYKGSARSKAKAFALGFLLFGHLSLPPALALPMARRLLNYPADRS